MQLVLDVKDDYAKEVLGILDNLKNVMINSVTVKDDLSKKLNTISAYKMLDSDKQKESYKEIQIIEDSLNQAELIKSGKESKNWSTTRQRPLQNQSGKQLYINR